MRNGVHQPTYNSWQMMKNRCMNPAAEDYFYYGLRGIKVCPEWMQYDGFLRDMGERPPGLTLERRDGKKGYSKSNCCWATKTEQARNRAYARDIVSHKGRAQKTWEWAEELGILKTSFYLRLWRFRRGDITEAQLFAPNPRV
jgi:hypothetical protein